MSLDIELPELEVELDETQLKLPATLRGRVQRFGRLLFASPLHTLTTGVVFVSCLALIAWNLSRLEVLDELAALRSDAYRLQLQFRDVDRRLQSINMNKIQSQIQRENERVFQGFPELAAWAEGLARYAASNNVGFRFRATNVHLSPVPEVLEIPLTLEFRRPEGGSDTLFTDAMKVVNTVLSDHWHVDVVSTSASGTGDALDELNLEAQVWVRDRFGFVDLDTLSVSSTTLPEESVSMPGTQNSDLNL